MGLAVWCATWLVAGFVGAWLALGYARRRALVDLPGERRSHAVPTPRGGGAAIALAVVLATGWLAWRTPAHLPALGGFGIGIVLVSLVGWLDDHRSLSAWLRLGVHVLAGGVFAAGAWLQWGDGWVALVAFGATVGLVNAWNFMDGIDGLAATQAILASAIPAALAGMPWLALGIALGAATLGFLPWNFPRARLFLGDVGSGALGFTVGGLVAMAMAGSGPRALVLALLPLSAFMIDAGLTLASRVWRRERWWQPHVSHAYQCAARRHGHVAVTLGYAAWTFLALAAAWNLRNVAFTSLIIALLPWYGSGSAAWWLLRRGGAMPVMENKE